MRTSLGELHARIPGAPTARAPDGEGYAQAFAHGTMSFGLYAPVGTDPQQPHSQDELYIVQSGAGEIVIAGERHPFSPGDVFFVAAGVVHRFEHFTPGFAAWVVFWGPTGGER
jgi:mannose-6-phosphate isomerase-like protein (cupin superfamily)